MRRPIFKMLAFALGSSALIVGANSCEKDEKEKEEVICCSWTSYYTQQEREACEGDQNPFNNMEILTGENWEDFKDYIINYYSGTCE